MTSHSPFADNSVSHRHGDHGGVVQRTKSNDRNSANASVSHPPQQQQQNPMNASGSIQRTNTNASIDMAMSRQRSTVLTSDNSVSLAWKHVTYTVEVDNHARKEDPSQPARVMKTLLHDMSGIARAGRVLAIMGASGAGKTTLMNALAGRLTVDKTHILDGSCELNGVPFANEFKPILTIVSQDDIVMGKETPRDALKFSAQMRLGLNSTPADARTDDMLNVLSLEKCAGTFIGIPGAIKGVSGGEKKRVNIGCELITNPSIVIMDEPTTGLDSVNATRIGILMQDLTRNHGRTVICTVHTPSSELFDMFDDLLLLAKGHVIYHGPREDAVAYFASLGHPVPDHTNPIEHYMDTLQYAPEELARMWTNWSNQIVDSDRNHCVRHYPKPAEGEVARLQENCQRRGAGLGHQFGLLTRRAFRMTKRDPASTIGRLFLTIAISVVIGLFYFGVSRTYTGAQNISGVLFLAVLNQLFMAMMPGVVMFPAERAIFLNEQSAAMYHPAVYTVARILAELPTNIFFPILYTGIIYYMIDLRNDPQYFFVFMLIMVYMGLTGFSLGLFASAIFPRLETAMAFLPVIIMPLSIVAGLFANTKRLDPYWLWLQYISFPRYGYSALVVNEFKGRSLCPDGDTQCLYQTGDDYLVVIGFDDWNWWMSAWIFPLYILFFCLCAMIALSVQGLQRRGTLAFKAKTADDPDVEMLREREEQRKAGGGTSAQQQPETY